MSGLTKGAKSENNEFLYSKSMEEKPILSKEYDKEAFILNYQLDYKKENIKRLTEERKNLENDFKTSCKMKEQLHNDLQNVVGTEMKHWLQYQEDCEAEEKQIALQLEEAKRRKCNLVEVAQIHLQEMEDILKNTKQMLSEKEERIEKYQTYIRFTYKQLQDEIRTLQDTIKLIASKFVDDKAFIKMCMEQSQHLLKRRTQSDVETIKIETLNLGIENLTSDKWKVVPKYGIAENIVTYDNLLSAGTVLPNYAGIPLPDPLQGRNVDKRWKRTTTDIQSGNILALKEIPLCNTYRIQVKVEPHSFLNVCKGLVTCYDLDYDLLEEERLHYELNIQAAEVKRLTHSLTTIGS
uniref:(California timema) hypothetical protein n=1 Tax=Timema californicum TaxID=61474 RepID=A0A7R9J383_TIMCA|nr:unnamed protein product [Timema californicum]